MSANLLLWTRRALSLAVGACLLAAALTGCGVRQRRQATETAEAATSVPASAAPAEASATPADAPGDALDGQLEALSTELSSADTLGDLETALPPDGPTATLAAEAATATPEANATTGVSEPDQGAEIEQLLDGLQNKLDQTDTVAEAANP